MSIQEYVNDTLCVPVTRVGNRYIVEAIELVLDTHEHKFYSKLAEIHNTTTKYLEKALRDAKNLSLNYMTPQNRWDIFGKSDVATNEYIIRAAEYYRRKYEDKS